MNNEIKKSPLEMVVDSYVGEAMETITPDVKTSLGKIVAQLSICDYVNHAGCLENNVAFIALKKLAGL